MTTLTKKMAVFTGCCILAASLSGCGNGGQSGGNVDDASEYVARGATDARFIDPAVTEGDELLAIGDRNVEERLRAGKLSAMSGQQLMRVYPNPSITAYPEGYAGNAAAMAASYLGTPYEYGSDRSEPSTFDCSDFTRWAYLSGLGMDIPMDSRSQARYILAYSKRAYWNIAEAKKGDLLFFIGYRGGNPASYEGADKSIDRISHVGMALGDGRMIHTASASTGGVRIDPVTGNHLQYRFVVGGSVLE